MSVVEAGSPALGCGSIYIYIWSKYIYIYICYIDVYMEIAQLFGTVAYSLWLLLRDIFMENASIEVL